jgi:hypothetical protein
MSKCISSVRSSALQGDYSVNSLTKLLEELGQLLSSSAPRSRDPFAPSQHDSGILWYSALGVTSQFYVICCTRMYLPKLYPDFLFVYSLERPEIQGFRSLLIAGNCSVFNIIYVRKIYGVEATNKDVGINALCCEEESFLV